MTITTTAAVARLADLPTRISKRVLVDEHGCWLWQGPIHHNGYARSYYVGMSRYAHRITYQLLVGPVPDGLQLDHLCRVRHCINPAHLEAVTRSENVARGIHGGALTGRCRSGLHPAAPRGSQCKECRTEYFRRRNANKKPCMVCGKPIGPSNYQRHLREKHA